MADLAEIPAIDLPVHSVRDFLGLIAAVRKAGVRDPLRSMEDCLLDLVAEIDD